MAAQYGTAGGPRDKYLLKAAELSAMAQIETHPAHKVEFENLSRAYLRLAAQAERNNQVYETAQKRDRNQAQERPPSRLNGESNSGLVIDCVLPPKGEPKPKPQPQPEPTPKP